MRHTWDANRQSSGWSGGLVDWTHGYDAFISVVFSWQISDAYQKAIWYATQNYVVYVGGPAAMLNPEPFRQFESAQRIHYAKVRDSVSALPHHNPNATFTTRGCIRKCKFCAVPKIEGELVELSDWEPKPVICDNNLLAASRKHFDRVIDRLKPLTDIDFNQGLDARLVTDYHAQRLSELRYKCIRLAWDHTKTEPQFMQAFETLRKAGIPPSKIHVYVLIGFDDDPQDALYRLETVAKLGAYPNPMRYQPLDSKRRNEYVAPSWTDAELKRYMRYWANLRITRRVPFAEFRHRGDEPKPIPQEQLAMQIT